MWSFESFYTEKKPRGFINYWHGQELFKLLLFMKSQFFYFVIINTISHDLVTQWKQKLHSSTDL